MEIIKKDLKTFFEGQKSYCVPPYQRPYSWGLANWAGLWANLEDLLDNLDKGRFFGPVILQKMQDLGGSSGIDIYLIIDGQQRALTITVLLAALQKRISHLMKYGGHDPVHMYLYNQGADEPKVTAASRLKLQPKGGVDTVDGDGETLDYILSGGAKPDQDHLLTKAYNFFQQQVALLDQTQCDSLLRIILKKLYVSSHELEDGDLPLEIFESINAKGLHLNGADIFRLCFFQRKATYEDICEAYNSQWRAIEGRVMDLKKTVDKKAGGNVNPMLPFTSAFLSSQVGKHVPVKSKGSDTDKAYEASQDFFKQHTDDEVYTLLSRASKNYRKLHIPTEEENLEVRQALVRIKAVGTTICHPFLLRTYQGRDTGQLSEDEFVGYIKAVENLIMRSFACSSNQLPFDNFDKLYDTMQQVGSKSAVGICFNQEQYPNDNHMQHGMLTYARDSTKAGAKLRCFLKILEYYTKPDDKERIDWLGTDKHTLEHMFPRNPSPSWEDDLTLEEYEAMVKLRGTWGNLTLSAYNSELGNRPWLEKIEKLKGDKLNLNKEVASKWPNRWNPDTVRDRTRVLFNRVVTYWPYLDESTSLVRETPSPQTAPLLKLEGTPVSIKVGSQEHPCRSWQDALVRLFQTLSEEDLYRVSAYKPEYVSKDTGGWKSSLDLDFGYHFNTENPINSRQASAVLNATLPHTSIEPESWIITTDKERQIQEESEDSKLAENAETFLNSFQE